jgi:hypothetical protein
MQFTRPRFSVRQSMVLVGIAGIAIWLVVPGITISQDPSGWVLHHIYLFPDTGSVGRPCSQARGYVLAEISPCRAGPTMARQLSLFL